MVVEIASVEPGTAPELLTLTSGAAEGGDPIAWRLEGLPMEQGSGAQAEKWAVLDERTAQRFPWRRQLRPFRLAQPAACARYRLVVTEAAGPLVLAGIELLA